MLESEAAKYKTYLESITTRELVKLADKAGISTPPNLDRIFIIRELLDNALDEETPAAPFSKITPYTENESYTPDSDTAELPVPVEEVSSHSPKTASLPLQYHITYLEVLPRDPQWVYVFWEIKAQERERYEADTRFEGYALKALENKKSTDLSATNCKDSDFTESFSVTVGKEDNSWYLGFPSGGVYRVALWIRGLNTTLIASRPFVLPKFLNSPGNKNLLTFPLIKLSGVSDFSVLRSTDRVSQLVHE